jgi:hypothetical protein
MLTISNVFEKIIFPLPFSPVRFIKSKQKETFHIGG